jgi:hypothetical protein
MYLNLKKCFAKKRNFFKIKYFKICNVLEPTRFVEHIFIFNVCLVFNDLQRQIYAL